MMIYRRSICLYNRLRKRRNEQFASAADLICVIAIEIFFRAGVICIYIFLGKMLAVTAAVARV